MKYDDLEKTQDLFAINDDVPEPIQNIEMEGANKKNVTNELTFGLEPDSEEEETVEGVKKESSPLKEKKEKKEKKNLKAKWASLSKKQKILIISGLVLFLILIIGLILFLVFKKEENLEENKKPKEPVVIVEEENYRFEDGTLIFLNKEKQELGKYECTNKEEDLCFIADYSDEDTFDVSKNVYEDGTIIPKKSKIYLDNYVFIYDNADAKEGLISLYNIKEEKVEDTYKLVKGFSDSDYVILKNTSDKYGAILFTSEGIKDKIEFSFSYLGRLNKSSNIVAQNKNKYFIYNEDGKLLNKELAYEIKSYNNKYVVVEDDKYYLYDYNGELVFDSPADYISLLDNYVIVIIDGKLYIRDYEGNKYNEEGVELNNKNYNLVNVYDENKRLKETKSAFGVTVNSDSINITYINKKAEKNKLINIYEGKLSSNLAFMNYFDSTLYFYGNEEKTELLGKYVCSNKNVVTQNTTDLSNCHVATESYFNINTGKNTSEVGLIPIFNKRYVFLIDYLDKANMTVNLYDLKNNKVLVKYASVDAGIHIKEENLTFVEEPVIYIMAQNRNKKYGIIKIDEEVSGLVAFDYANMEKMKDYFLAQSEQETYMLIDKTGNIVTEKLGRKIVDYAGDYLATLSDDKYYICDFNGETNDNTGYLDIKLYNDYYVKITSSYELDIGKYDDGTFGLSETIYIGSDYKDNYDVIRNSNGGFRVIIKSTGETYNYTSGGILQAESD